MSTKTDLYVCPKCGSPAVDTALIVGSANCAGCGWVGGMKELVLAGQVDTQAAERRAFELSAEFVRVFAEGYSEKMVVFFVRWGFLPNKGKKAELVERSKRYLTVMSRAALSALLEEVRTIEVEEAKKRANASSN